MFCNDAIWSMQQAGAAGEGWAGGGGVGRGAKGRGLSSRPQAGPVGTQLSPLEGSLHVSVPTSRHTVPLLPPPLPKQNVPSGEWSVFPRVIPRGTLHSRVNGAHVRARRTACVLGAAEGWAGFSLLIPPLRPPPLQERVEELLVPWRPKRGMLSRQNVITPLEPSQDTARAITPPLC